MMLGFPGGSEVKNLPANAEDMSLIPQLGKSPGEGNGSPLRYSCLENPMDGGAWWATVSACLTVTPWTAAHQAPPSMGFSRQEYRSGVSLPSPDEIKRLTS